MKADNKFTIVYSFRVVEGKEKEFIDYWSEMTQLIYEFEGSYGSRLHKVNDHFFIAYAQWPDQETFDQSWNNLPESANSVSQKMRESCTEIKKVYEMTVVQDLLKTQKYKETED